MFLGALFPGLLAAAAMAWLVEETGGLSQLERPLLKDLRQLPIGFRYYVLTVGVFGLEQFAPTLLIFRASQLPLLCIGKIVLRYLCRVVIDFLTYPAKYL